MLKRDLKIILLSFMALLVVLICLILNYYYSDRAINVDCYDYLGRYEISVNIANWDIRKAISYETPIYGLLTITNNQDNTIYSSDISKPSLYYRKESALYKNFFDVKSGNQSIIISHDLKRAVYNYIPLECFQIG